MNTEVDISIVIVNYNVKDFLYQCLLSVKTALSNLNVEIIVIDNNSSDDSAATIPQIFPEVVFKVMPTNVGFGKANNIGFSIAKGKYILILNPDTVLQEDTLTTMFDYMEHHQEVGIAGCKVLNPDGSFQLACRRGFPTPWAAFCKLFGLQSFFPKSKFFARYNQTFRNENETYYIDAVIGAFMFARRDVIDKLRGFDEDFFMYGEDLDLCFRTTELGYKVAYVHTTSIIHYKGESTKRSSINDTGHFYKAMEIFAKKHSANSLPMLLLLKCGIKIRSLITSISRRKEDILFLITDTVMLNLFLLLSTFLRFGNWFNFPPYAYPTVFVVVSLTSFLSMFFIGEYFENGKSIRRSFVSLLITFFILSSLTYYFKEYAFSRGVLLMTIAFTIAGTSFSRGCRLLFDMIRGKQSDKNIAIAGYDDNMKRVLESICNSEIRNSNFIGIIEIGHNNSSNYGNLNIIGNFDYIDKIISRYHLNEVIINSSMLSNNELLKIISKNGNKKVRFHLIKEYDDIIVARIIDDITNSESTVPHYNISKIRIKFIKRLTDICITGVLLVLGSPLRIFGNRRQKNLLKDLFSVFSGKKTLIGIYPSNNEVNNSLCKTGLIGLATISFPKYLTSQSIDKLNDYYLKHYSLFLDIDILIKYLLRRKTQI